MAKEKKGMMRHMKYSVIGIELAVSVAVGGFIGYFLDSYFGTEPWLFIFWLICGIAAGFRSLYRMSKQYLNEVDKDDTDQRSD